MLPHHGLVSSVPNWKSKRFPLFCSPPTENQPATSPLRTHVRVSLWTCGQHFCGRKLLWYNGWDTGASGTYSSWFKFPKIKCLKHNEWSFSYGIVVIFKTFRGLRFININVSAHCLIIPSTPSIVILLFLTFGEKACYTAILWFGNSHTVHINSTLLTFSNIQYI